MFPFAHSKCSPQPRAASGNCRAFFSCDYGCPSHTAQACVSAAGLVSSERWGGCCQAGLCVLISSGSHPASTAPPLRVLRKAGKGFAILLGATQLESGLSSMKPTLSFNCWWKGRMVSGLRRLTGLCSECACLLSKLSVSTVPPPVSPEAVRRPSWVSAMHPERT